MCFNYFAGDWLLAQCFSLVDVRCCIHSGQMVNFCLLVLGSIGAEGSVRAKYHQLLSCAFPKRDRGRVRKKYSLPSYVVSWKGSRSNT